MIFGACRSGTANRGQLGTEYRKEGIYNYHLFIKGVRLLQCVHVLISRNTVFAQFSSGTVVLLDPPQHTNSSSLASVLSTIPSIMLLGMSPS